MFRTTVHTRRPAWLAATTGVLAAGVVAGALSAPAAATAATYKTVTTAVDPRDALLRAAQMPLVNEVQQWSRVATRHTRVSTAQPEALKALGFTDRARRDFAIPGGQASSVVLTFTDDATAAEAYAEIRAWRQHTGDNVPAAGKLLHTSRSTPVAVEAGRGAYFSFVFKTDQDAVEGTFEWLGVTRRGDAVSIVAWRIGGQDASYEVDPTIASVKAANATLSRLG